MTKPKMIIFDYGHTLVYEPFWNPLEGTRELMKYSVKNPMCLTPQQVVESNPEMIKTVKSLAVANDLEIRAYDVRRAQFGMLGIELSLTDDEADTVFWDGSAPGYAMDGAEELLVYIKQQGIRTGVISNISFSGAALTNRLNRLFPGNHFEFILASSEYCFRKPLPYMFMLALEMAKLDSSQVWFVGDQVKADIDGSAAVGMFPIMLKTDLNCEYARPGNDDEPKADHLTIYSLRELKQIISNCEKQ